MGYRFFNSARTKGAGCPLGLDRYGAFREVDALLYNESRRIDCRLDRRGELCGGYSARVDAIADRLDDWAAEYDPANVGIDDATTELFTRTFGPAYHLSRLAATLAPEFDIVVAGLLAGEETLVQKESIDRLLYSWLLPYAEREHARRFDLFVKAAGSSGSLAADTATRIRERLNALRFDWADEDLAPIVRACGCVGDDVSDDLCDSCYKAYDENEPRCLPRLRALMPRVVPDVALAIPVDRDDVARRFSDLVTQ